MLNRRRPARSVLPAALLGLCLLRLYTMLSTPPPAATPRSAEDDVRVPTQGFVIAMSNETGWKVARRLQRAFGILDMHVVVGHVGDAAKLSLYNRNLMRHGRTDTLQIGNVNMLGCLESHRDAWARVRQTSYVFEEDALPAAGAMRTVRRLLVDNAHRPWSVIHLETPSGFVARHSFAPDLDQYTNIGQITQTCRDCIVYSNRGYILNPQAAQILLENYDPPLVQADAYMSLLNAYHPTFRQVWTRVQAVDWNPHVSAVQQVELMSVQHALLNLLAPPRVATRAETERI
ncbi:MAG: hypothetical protein WCP53_00250 [Verrucomicrobiota bacterium]